MSRPLIKQSGIYLFKLFNFEIRLDWSWFFLALLITFTLALAYFPSSYPGLSILTYWIMSIIGAIGLFGSIILHELCHSLVGRYYGLPIEGIKLFIFGGIAKMHSEPPNPKAEFLMALAGPIFSLLFGIFFVLLTLLLFKLKFPIAVIGIIAYLATINIIIGIFNLLPGYPLDGGRILRAFIWWWKKDLKLATRIASRIGIAISFALIFLGIMLFMNQDIIGGVWLILLGFFLFQIAKLSYQQLVVKEIFADDPIEKYISSNHVNVTPNITVQQCIDDFFYKTFARFYTVTYHDKVVGCITLESISKLPKQNWLDLQIKDVMQQCPPEIIIDADTKMREIIDKIVSFKMDYFILVRQNKYYATVSRNDLVDIITIKNSFENHE